jgi:hypothetical protein
MTNVTLRADGIENCRLMKIKMQNLGMSYETGADNLLSYAIISDNLGLDHVRLVD